MEGPTRADSSSLSGLHLVPTPSISATHEGSWDSLVAADLALVRIDESALLAGYGVSLGVGTFAAGRRVRSSADLLLGSSLGLGMSLGASIDFASVEPSRLGVNVGLWYFVGAMPYLRVGTVDGRGRYLELGLKIPLPALRW